MSAKMIEKLYEAIDKEAGAVLSERDQARGKLNTLQEALSGYKTKSVAISSEIDDLKSKMALSIKSGKKSDELFNKRAGLMVDMQLCKELIEEIEDSLLPEAVREVERIERDLGQAVTAVFSTLGNDFEAELDLIVQQHIEPFIAAWPKSCWKISTELNVAAPHRELRIRSRTVRDHCDRF